MIFSFSGTSALHNTKRWLLVICLSQIQIQAVQHSTKEKRSLCMLRLSTKANTLTPHRMQRGNCVGSSNIQSFGAWLPHTYMVNSCLTNTTRTADLPVQCWNHHQGGMWALHTDFSVIFTSITYGYNCKVQSSPTEAHPSFKSRLIWLPSPHSHPKACIRLPESSIRS